MNQLKKIYQRLDPVLDKFTIGKWWRPENINEAIELINNSSYPLEDKETIIQTFQKMKSKDNLFCNFNIDLRN